MPISSPSYGWARMEQRMPAGPHPRASPRSVQSPSPPNAARRGAHMATLEGPHRRTNHAWPAALHRSPDDLAVP